MNSPQRHSESLADLLKPVGAILLVGAVFSGLLLLLALGSSLSGSSLVQAIQSLFAMDSVQIWWYVTRAAGLTGYLLLWLSMVWGFAISSRILQPVVESTFTYDFHEHLSLLGLGFVLLHITVLLFDHYLPFSLLQLLIPFVDSYRPFWVGLGIISFDILLLVTFTFYLRQRIGVQRFRSIHLLSMLSYLGTTLHGLFAGTDSGLPVTMLLYAGTFLVVVFLTVYWLVIRRIRKDDDATTVVAVRSQR